MLPAPGQIVHVRSRQYLVEEVTRPIELRKGECSLVRMACLEDDAQGEPLEVLWEREVDAEIRSGLAWSEVAGHGFDPSETFSAYLHTLRWNCVTSTDSRLLQAPFRAGIDIKTYQLEPLRKALLLPRVNLFIADDVGLGKTIEAGLIVRELLQRQKVRRIVVAAPPSIVPQWREELEGRFGLTFVVMDRAFVEKVRRERGWATNPWSTHSRFVISHALLRDETYAMPLRDWLDTFAGAASMLILDEAHHAAPASGARYAIDSRFTRVVRDVASRFEHRLFLSATPHNGHTNSFSALLEILDPQRFTRGVPIASAAQLDAVMVRRLKEDLREIGNTFPIRKVRQWDIDGLPPDAPELRLAELLARYRALRETRLAEATRSTRNASALVHLSLQKRLLSSIEAFACTLRVHRRAVDRQHARLLAEGAAAPVAASLAQLSLLGESPDSDDDRAEEAEDRVQAEEDAAMEAATASSTPTTAALLEREIALLDEMERIAEAHRCEPDPRIQRLVDWIREFQCPGLPALGSRERAPAAWLPVRVILFTEYADTKRYLEQQLRAAIAGTDRAEQRLATFHGGMGDNSREAVKAAFNADPATHPLRILVCTDAAREGVNLQNHCADLFHFDVPWNPSRMEQRNGRIDRTLQRAKTVYCHYFLFHQRPEDRVLQALVRKTGIIRKELGSLAPVLEARLTVMLQGGIGHDRVDELARAIDQARLEEETTQRVALELEAARERQAALQQSLDRLRGQLQRSEQFINYNVGQLQQALDVGLRLHGAEPLKADPSREGAWRFPTLDADRGATSSWAPTLDALRVPRKRDQKPWEWRHEAPLRPIIFADPGFLDESAVHLHLEHRLVRRLLGGFLAQGFVHHDLSRACVGTSRDPIPRVVLLGRLSLYGAGASRLHDEVIPIAARWREPQTRAVPLAPFAERGEATTLDLLESALHAPREVPEAISRAMLGAIARDVEELRPHLEERAAQCEAKARAALCTRGQAEAKAMTSILEAQRKRIEQRVAEFPPEQLHLPFKDQRRETERRQQVSEHRRWRERLAQIPRELETEPARIRATYEVVARRVEPVGVVYLWPVTG
ncbi:MAG: DISARM system SNF2-like helicase DrmD [Pseudomonadota bacterium]